MSESFEKVLHDEDGLVITFVVEGDATRLEFRAAQGIDLTAHEDVVVVVNGRGFETVAQDASFAVTALGSWETLSEAPIQLMIRVHEFFEGWELD
jgi:hypothetical protein